MAQYNIEVTSTSGDAVQFIVTANPDEVKTIDGATVVSSTIEDGRSVILASQVTNGNALRAPVETLLRQAMAQAVPQGDMVLLSALAAGSLNGLAETLTQGVSRASQGDWSQVAKMEDGTLTVPASVVHERFQDGELAGVALYFAMTKDGDNYIVDLSAPAAIKGSANALKAAS